MSEPEGSRPEGPSARAWRGADTPAAHTFDERKEAP